MNRFVAPSGTILIYLVCWSSLLHCSRALQTLEILFQSGDRPGDGFLLEDNLPTVAAYIKRAEKLCVNGLWGLYSQSNYGITDIGNTTVIPIQGKGRNDCTESSVAPIMANINSIRKFGGTDLSMDAFEPFPNKYFLYENEADHTIGLPVAPFDKVKSFAVTGILKLYKLCGPTADRCICLDMTRNGPFLVPDLDYFPNTTPLKTLVSAAGSNTAECQALERPIGGLRSQRAPLADE